MIRIEATFTVKEVPKNFNKLPKETIEQHYFDETEDATRLRKVNDQKYSLTRKILAVPGNTRYREVVDLPINKNEFARLEKAAISSITKNRYKFNDQIRIDEFTGKLKGLILAEVVFYDEVSFKGFAPPDWFGRDVTEEDWASNIYLSKVKFEDIKKKI